MLVHNGSLLQTNHAMSLLQTILNASLSIKCTTDKQFLLESGTPTFLFRNSRQDQLWFIWLTLWSPQTMVGQRCHRMLSSYSMTFITRCLPWVLKYVGSDVPSQAPFLLLFVLDESHVSDPPIGQWIRRPPSETYSSAEVNQKGSTNAWHTWDPTLLSFSGCRKHCCLALWERVEKKHHVLDLYVNKSNLLSYHGDSLILWSTN